MPMVPPGSPFEEFFKEFLERSQPRQRQRRATSLGSGFIVDEQGYVITNNHVIQDADEISVILHDETRLEAKVIGRDTKTDIAVLKVEPQGESCRRSSSATPTRCESETGWSPSAIRSVSAER